MRNKRKKEGHFYKAYKGPFTQEEAIQLANDLNAGNAVEARVQRRPTGSRTKVDKLKGTKFDVYVR